MFFIQFIPVVGWFFSIAILVEFVKTFGKFRFYQHALTVCTLGLYFLYIGLNKKDKFIGAEAARKYKKSAAREWIDAGIFAVIAATLIRTFVFEAYVIPTPSMEKTLLVNDFLFVSKFSYGPAYSEYTHCNALRTSYHAAVRRKIVRGMDSYSLYALVCCACKKE
ncbi:MAG: DUF5684 domain-containing protein [Puia sp.]